MAIHCPRMLGEMREWLIWLLSTTGTHIFRSVGVDKVNENREKVGEEAGEEIRMRSLFLHLVPSRCDAMSKLFKDN